MKKERNIFMNKATNIIDSVAIISGTAGATFASQIGDWLGVVMSAMSIIAVIVTCTLRIVDSVRKSKADGKITDDEKEIIKDTIVSSLDEIKETISKAEQKKDKEDGE